MKKECIDMPIEGLKRLRNKFVRAQMKRVRNGKHSVVLNIDKLVLILEHNGNLKDLML